MFKVNNSFWCFYCQLWTYFSPISRVSIANYELVNVSGVTHIGGYFSLLITHWSPNDQFKIRISIIKID